MIKLCQKTSVETRVCRNINPAGTNYSVRMEQTSFTTSKCETQSGEKLFLSQGEQYSIILGPSAFGFGNARVSSGKFCVGVASKIWLYIWASQRMLFDPNKTFCSFISTSSRKSCAVSVLELKKFS